MTYPLKPLDQHVVIRPDTTEQTTASGIILPDEVNEWTARGVVMAVGPGRRDKKGIVNEMDARVGDLVLYPKGEGQELGIERDIILPETHILGTLDDDFTPYWDKLLVELDAADRVRDSGIIIQGDGDRTYDVGKVLAVGPGFPDLGRRTPSELSVGDKIIFSQFDSMEIDVKSDDVRRLFITRDNNVKAILL